jgi:hypothetical protein
MIFRVMFKTPDALDPVIDNLCHTSSCGGPECGDDGNPRYCEECEELAHAFQDEQKAIHKFAEKFIQYNEYVTIEFDTEAKTAVVVPVK